MTSTTPVDSSPLLLNVRNATVQVTPEQFDQLCRDNPDLRLELTQAGELIVMPPTGGQTGAQNFELIVEVGLWNRQTQLGRAFDSSTGYDFTALGGGKLSPDVSWIASHRLEGVDLTGFIPIVPDFVAELRSPSDAIDRLRTKMQEYRRLGVRLGLLINSQDRQVELYRPQEDVVVLDAPEVVDCSEVMPGFLLPMARLWI
ncbi:Uma2 family endonuclease [Thermosynechococcus sp. JY1334]|uniref:Uma2 family endonuclease n=1 Tax=unclassified Thermosynechococcus TaxID=2622553 RepID=UPI0026717EC1|nr:MULTISPECIES: Uma2 family endonuclease [unclassified Thermosynechococcus]MDR7897685.1 Uma2 family endonuclease [Thermosynechococcus sp. JY1332]MDR7905083.1 Uma2 family endonuclease [Thermosynechococcus sp. JY1334]MDR7992909.1 Uma2 family endonuclease [Thermosynechococcus sp. TG252]WKT87305.1 Uma2 family endonuclease [Thermosynechococcus sp. JY1339]WNC56247.1 Uma2 family endonuclease [Thermosynechococcus sp. JY1331]